MREIKFRGRCAYTGEWLHGGLIQLENVTRICWINENNVFCSALVDKNTLTQYTGLKDKNGREIYEGDIIEQLSERTYESVKGIVKFVDGSYLLEFLSGDNGCYLFDEVAYNEVLGNIYENPELLEVQA